MSHNPIVKMTVILIYWSLIQQIYSVNSFKVNILNMSDLTTNSDVRINDDVNNASEKKIVVPKISLDKSGKTWQEGSTSFQLLNF